MSRVKNPSWPTKKNVKMYLTEFEQGQQPAGSVSVIRKKEKKTLSSRNLVVVQRLRMTCIRSKLCNLFKSPVTDTC